MCMNMCCTIRFVFLNDYRLETSNNLFMSITETQICSWHDNRLLVLPLFHLLHREIIGCARHQLNITRLPAIQKTD